MTTEIAIDVRMARHTGIGTYIRGLVGELTHLNGFKDRAALYGAPAGAEFNGWRLLPFKSPIYSASEQMEYPFRLAGCRLWHAPHYNIPVINNGAKLVVTVHDLIHWIFRKHFFTPLQAAYASFMFRRVVSTADRIITVSHQTERDLVEHFKADPEKISVIHEGIPAAPVPAALEEVRQKYGFPEEYFLYVGALKPHKNVPLLLRAFRRLRKEAKLRASLVIVGKKDARYGPEMNDLASLESGEGILHVPFVEHEDLAAFYQGATALVHPSLYEGFGLTILEAMAAGTPVIACRAGSIPEVAGQAALLVPPGDERALAEAMVRLESDPGLVQELSAKGLRQAQNFSWDKTAAETLKVYERVLSGKR